MEGNEIVGTSVPNTGNSFLCTRRDYSNFILELQFKVQNKLNSGVQNPQPVLRRTKDRSLRQKENPDCRRPGPRLPGGNRPSARAWTGGIYDEGRRGWLADLKNNEAARHAFKPEAWNSFRIEAKGDTIKTWLNGVPAAELTDAVTPSGFIALQVHGVGKRNESLQVRFRDIRIKQLQ